MLTSKKMKIVRNILTVCVASSLLGACNVDRFPFDKFSSEQLESDPDYVNQAANGMYAYLKGEGQSSCWINNAHRIAEYPSDNVALSGTTTDDLYYMYNYQRIDNGGRNNDFWLRCYRANYSANKLISTTEEGVSTENDHRIGEAYFVRAWMHFALVNAYGKQYTIDKNALGVPVKITSDVDDLPARSTVAQVYEQIIKDLNKAATLMAGMDKEPYFANQNAAYACLSRVYLYMGDNENALKYANLVIDTHKQELLTADQFRKMNTLTPENNPEAIFSIRYITDLDEGDQDNGVGGFYAEINSYGWGEMYASRTILDLANYFPDDARQAFFLPKYTDESKSDKEGLWVRHELSDGALCPKYRSGVYSVKDGKEILTTKEGENERVITLSKRNTPTGVEQYYFNEGQGDTIVYVDKVVDKRNGYPKIYITKCSLQDNKIHSWSPTIFRLAEMYLNKAEALCKLNRKSEAITALNDLRQKRGIPDYVDGDVVLGRGRTDLLDVILDERRLELAYEGHRTYDIFRNNKVLNRDYPGTHAVNSSQRLKINATDKDAVQLLPLSQLNVQGNLVQNEK